MIKKTLTLLIVISMLFSLCVNSFANDDDITLIINNKKITSDVSPVIVNNRVLVPVRVIFDEFGADVRWDNSLRQAIITTKKSVIIFTIDSKYAYVDGVSFLLDSPAKIIDNRTFVPIRFLSERLKYNVSWNATKRTVTITGNKYSVDEDVTDNNLQDLETTDKPTTDNTETDNNKKNYDTDFKSVKITDDDNEITIKISVSKKTTPDVMRLSSPNRIVFDFKEVNQLCDDEKLTFEDSSVSAIRWALHEDYTRLVVETTKVETYKITSTTSYCKIVISKTSYEEDNDKKDEESKENEDKPVTDKPVNSSYPVVVLDPGHGGKDSGAVGKNENDEIVIYEDELNLKIALKVRDELLKYNINVIMTRTKDVGLGATVMEDLVERAEIANRNKADLFVSIHNNSHTDSVANGTTVLYPGLSNSGAYAITSEELAQNIQDELVDRTTLRDRQITLSPEMVVLKRTLMPAVLVECGFVSSYEDQKILTNEKGINAISKAICEGIVKSLKDSGKLQ